MAFSFYFKSTKKNQKGLKSFNFYNNYDKNNYFKLCCGLHQEKSAKHNISPVEQQYKQDRTNQN